MFGYVRPSDARLTESERETFRGAYCGLCHALGRRYGWAGRMILNYDLTFLAMVLSRGEGSQCHKRCLLHPIRKRCCCQGDSAFDTAADMSVILTYWQLKDGVADHGFFGGLKYHLALLALGGAYRKAQRFQPAFDRQTEAHLRQLSRLEKENCPSLDAPADAFASLLAGAAGGIAEESRRRVTEQLLYHLGRWVYLVDAADDLKKDAESGSYNPLPLRYAVKNGALSPEDRQSLAATLDGSVRSMAAAFELLEESIYTPVLRSVVYEGLYAVGSAVLNGTFHRREKREEPIRKADTDHA